MYQYDVVDFSAEEKFPLVRYNRTLSCWDGHLACLDFLDVHSDNTGSTVTLLAVVGDFDPGRVGHGLDWLTDDCLDRLAIDCYLVVVLWSL